MIRFLQLSLFFLSTCPGLNLLAQDIHFSQFYNTPQLLNPAFTAAFEEDEQFAAAYRRQWFSVPVSYETFTGAYSRKLLRPWLGEHLIGLGGSLAYDQAGDGSLSWLQLSLQGAYHWKASDEHTLSAGLQFRAGQRALQARQFRFGDQFVDNLFDPGQATAESLGANSAGFVSLGAGFSWTYQAERQRSGLRAGAGFAHLNRPSISFFDDGTVELPVLFTMHALGRIELEENWDVALNVLGQQQGAYRELLAMAGGKYYLNQKKGEELALQLGVGYRLSDALVGYLEVFYQSWRVGLSYDVNTSPFHAATQRRGGPELALRYAITHVKPPKEFKACPIF